jgi:hypothetical protein
VVQRRTLTGWSGAEVPARFARPCKPPWKCPNGSKDRCDLHATELGESADPAWQVEVDQAVAAENVCARLALHWRVEQGDAADAMSGSEHTYAKNCLHCGDDRPGTHCDLAGYSARRIRFILAHREAFNAAYLDPNLSAASNEVERLSREYIELPPRHDCSCRCPNEQRGRPRCMECVRLDAQRPNGAGVRSSVTALMPATLMLDLERALAVLGNDGDAHAIAARYMSLNGTRADVPSRVRRRSHGATVELERICLMCSRPAVAGQQQCRHCGGCLVRSSIA